MKHIFLFCSIGILVFACQKEDCEKPSQCELKPDPGLCEAAIPKYFYNSVKGKCEEFIYGGCDGVVPFETLEECYECECDKRLE
jgi:hypothetical protein